LIIGFGYGSYLENGNIETPPAVTENFITKDADLSIHYIDVGQGDCSLVIFGETTILIDAGEKEMGERVIAYLNGQGIKKLDYIIATHPHSDHIGGLPNIIKTFDVGSVIAPRLAAEMIPTAKSYENFLVSLKNKALKLTAARNGSVYTIYSKKPDTSDDKVKAAEFEIISPISSKSDAYTDINNYSVVLKLTYKNTSFLFTGDASKPAEADILESNANISADVIKVPHHGSSSASTADYLKAVSPSIGIIQCGKDNSYSHPSEKIVSRYENADVTLYRNDIYGNIVVYSDGEKIKIIHD